MHCSALWSISATKITLRLTAVCFALAVASGSPAACAQSRKDPLTEQQVEAVREAGDQPAERLTLYVGFLDERAKGIHALGKDLHVQDRDLRIHNLCEEFTRLSDELQDNMDAFNEQHADMRKVLKQIIDKTAEWTTVLNEPAPNSQYDFARKTAVETNQTAHETASTMLPEQVKYFIELKKAQKEAEKAAQKESETR